jgi:methyl-accepting chemotaxis protein
MALVKTSEIRKRRGSRAAEAEADPPIPTKPAPTPRRTNGKSYGRQQKAAERIAAATEELASGVAEATAAAEELSRALEQISSGADEAASASQESLAAISALNTSFGQAREHATTSRRRTETLQGLLVETASQIDTSVAAVQANAKRQARSVEVISVLERQAADVGEITRAVGEVSDQTNLLALNAAIEAARAGDEGRGFAVVADEVRALAATSERSAGDVQNLASGIAQEVRSVAQRIKAAADRANEEAERGRTVVAALDTIRAGTAALSEGSQAVLLAAVEAETAAREAQRGAEQVAGAAEEQSAAAAEAQRAVQQQSESLDQSHRTAQALAILGENLQSSRSEGSNPAQLGAATEELSAAIQELSGAAGQIMTAVDQISRGAQAQAAATQQANAAMAQIERAAAIGRERAAAAIAQVETIAGSLAENRAIVSQLAQRSADALDEVRSVVNAIGELEASSRRIEKIVDSLSLIAVQTNMLAVSGSVEAARAGEAGRGFANVSADIRNLARDSAESAERIKDVVRSIRDQIAIARRDLEQIITVSEGEVVKATLVVEKLGSVEVEIAAVRSANREILAGADAIVGAVREVRVGTQQIATVAEQAGSAAAQAATAARQQARGAEDLAAAVEEIASLAEELQIAEA